MTVSRVMNDKPGVGDELRQQIQALAEEMGYRPSQVARGLATRQTSTIGLVVPDICNQFFAYIAHGAEDVAYENGYNLVLMNTAESLDREIAALDSLWQLDSDGIILCSSRLPIEELESNIQRMPAVVLLNRELSQPSDNVVSILVDDEVGARIAIERFLSIGRTRIGILAGPAYSYSAQRRLDGYKAELAEAGLVFDPFRLEHSEPTYMGGRMAMAAVLARRPKIDAVYAFNDLIALGAIQEIEAQGKRVPDDIAVIGSDDIPLASLVRPRLSSLRVDLVDLGRMAMESLLTLIRDGGKGDMPPSIKVPPQLITRETA